MIKRRKAIYFKALGDDFTDKATKVIPCRGRQLFVNKEGIYLLEGRMFEKRFNLFLGNKFDRDLAIAESYDIGLILETSKYSIILNEDILEKAKLKFFKEYQELEKKHKELNGQYKSLVKDYESLKIKKEGTIRKEILQEYAKITGAVFGGIKK